MLIRGPSAINGSVLLRYDPIHMIHAAPIKRIQNHPQYLFNMDDYTLPHRCAFPSGALWINQEQNVQQDSVNSLLESCVELIQAYCFSFRGQN